METFIVAKVSTRIFILNFYERYIITNEMSGKVHQ